MVFPHVTIYFLFSLCLLHLSTPIIQHVCTLQGRHISDYEVNPIRHLLERVNYMMGEVLTDVVKSSILEYADTMVRTVYFVDAFYHFIVYYVCT